MSDRQVAVAAVLIGCAARWHPGLPMWIAAGLAVFGAAVRRPWLLVLGCALIAGARAGGDLRSLEAVRPGPLHGMATVRTDPRPGPFATTFDVSLAGTRYAVEVSGGNIGSVSNLRVGEEIELNGVVRRFAQRQPWQIARHLAARLNVDHVGGFVEASFPWRLANGLRGMVLAGADGLDRDAAPLFKGLVLGDDSDHDDALVHRFRTSGLSHLLVVSGENVAFVLTAFAPLLRRLRLRSRWIVTLVILVIFGTIVRWEPSVLRAIAMAGLVVTASTLGRRVSGLRILSISVAALILLDPLLMWSLGFHLSVAATLGLVLWSPPIAERLPGPRWLADPLGVVLAAQLGVAPLILLLNGSIPAAGLPANLLAVPVAGWTMMWGATAGMMAGLAPTGVAHVLHVPTVWMIRWIDDVAAAAASPGLPQLGLVELSCCVTGLAAVMATRGRSFVVRQVVSVGAGVLLVGGLILGARGPAPGHIELAKDSDLVVGVHGEAILIVGGSSSPARVLKALVSARVGDLDALVVVGGRRAADTAGVLVEAWSVDTVIGGNDIRILDPDVARQALPAGPSTFRVGSVVLQVRVIDGHLRVAAPAVGWPP